ncbi:hypothetical protein VP01_8017g1, partial [Puccinia sorghi]
DDPEIDEPDMAEEEDEVDSANNEVVQTSSKRKGSATNRNKSNELNELTKAVIDSMLCDEYNKYQDQISQSSRKDNCIVQNLKLT